MLSAICKSIKPQRHAGMRFFSRHYGSLQIIKTSFHMTSSVPIKTGFVRTPTALEFLDTERTVQTVTECEAQLRKIDNTLRPSDKSRDLTPREVEFINNVTGFRLPLQTSKKEDDDNNYITSASTYIALDSSTNSAPR